MSDNRIASDELPEIVEENLLNFIWDQAVRLGVPGNPIEKTFPCPVDPEAFILLVNVFSDSRLQLEWAGWLQTFGDWIYVSRLKQILIELRETTNAGFIEPNLPSMKNSILFLEDEVERSFQPVLENLSDVEASVGNVPTGGTPKIRNISSQKIVSNAPPLFWRHICGVNSRAELLSAVGTDYRGNTNQLAEDLYLAANSIRRAVQSLTPTGLIEIEQVGNSKIISRGNEYPESFRRDTSTQPFDWVRLLRAILRIKPKIQNLKGKEISESLEERFTETVRSLLEEELLDPEFTHRHGKTSAQNALNRILP